MTQTSTNPAQDPEIPRRRNRLSQKPNLLFCYGTLQFDAVLQALLARIPERTPASAPGYRAAALEGRVYPGLVGSAPGDSASGVLLTDLSNDEWRILDAFEDDQYDLRKIDLSNGTSGWTYIWPGNDVRTEDWSAAEFEHRHLPAYAARCARLAPGLAAGEPKRDELFGGLRCGGDQPR